MTGACLRPASYGQRAIATSLVSAVLALAAAGCDTSRGNPPSQDFDAYLDTQVLAPRFPAAIESDGWGFRSRFTRDWRPLPETTRFLVYQARMSWTAAFVGRTRPAWSDTLVPAARHGFAALERFRDRDHGGFYTRVDLAGRPLGEGNKATYVQAYALSALAELARFAPLGDDARDDASRAARETFEWIERHAAVEGGGYRSAVARDGAPLPFDRDAVDPPRDGLGVPSAWRDFGTQLHLLEAYTAFLRAAPDDGDVRARAEALVDLLLGPFWSEPGCVHGALDADGRPVPNRVSFGHAVEAAALLLDAAETLGRPRDPRMVAAAQRLVDYALRWGFDVESGAWGTWASGVLARPRDRAMGFWVPFEAMHAIARLYLVVPDAQTRYAAPLAATWRFVRETMTDDRAPGFWEGLDRQGRVIDRKSGDWVATYHAARALVVAADALGAQRARCVTDAADPRACP